MLLDFQKYSVDSLIKKIKEIDKKDAYLESVLEFLINWQDESASFTIMSSGSTGPVKKMKFDRSSLIKSARITLKTFSLNEGDCVINALPLTFVAGKMMLVRAIIGKLKLLLLEPSSNPIQELDRKVEFAAFTPFQMQHIVDATPEKLNLIEKIIIGGSKVEPHLERRLDSVKSTVFETFGMSETLTHIAIRPINGKSKSEYFQILDSFDWNINEDDSLTISAEYLGKEAINTNDLVRKISPSQFLWLGRKDNVINTGGIKVYPEEIERKLSPFISIPFQIAKEKDDIFGEKVVLLIEEKNKENFQLSELNFSHLNKYEIPKKVVQINRFTRNNNGKLIRLKLDE